MAKYKELALLEREGDRYLAILPTSTAHADDVAVVEGELYKVIKTEWIDTERPIYQMITAAYTLLEPDQVLRLKWEKDETTNADS